MSVFIVRRNLTCYSSTVLCCVPLGIHVCFNLFCSFSIRNSVLSKWWILNLRAITIFLGGQIVLYLCTLWNRVLLEELTHSQLVEKYPAFYGTWRFITTFTSACHQSLSWARSIQSMPPHLTSWRSIVILSSHLCVGLHMVSFPQVFPLNPFQPSDAIWHHNFVCP